MGFLQGHWVDRSMALVEWSEEFSVGIESIDEQHKKLLNMLNALQFAVEQGKEESILHEIFVGLALYTQKHFDYEEQLLASHGYDEFESHKREHEILKVQVKTLQHRFESKEGVITGALIDFLKEWWTEHIQGSDQKYSAYMQERLAS